MQSVHAAAAVMDNIAPASAAMLPAPPSRAPCRRRRLSAATWTTSMCLVLCAASCSASRAPGLGYFEDEVRLLAAAPLTGAAPLDLRVAKAVGSKGYDKVRVSVISQGAAAAGIDLGFLAPQSYNESFRYRWVGAFDLGTKGTSCGADDVYNSSVGLGNSYDADCMLACTHDPRCHHYTWYDTTKTCELSGASCAYHPDPAAEATYATAGNNVLASAVVSMTPGPNRLEIGGHDITVVLPSQGAGVRGVVISDPCFSSRWVGCQWGSPWKTFNRTITMLNALASAGDIDFFGVLGDNFYDQDGRLTKAVWDRLNLDFKSKFLLTMPGNHDIWVPGGPPGDQYDQYAWGLQQFFAQDTVSSLSSPFLDFAGGGPDAMRNWSHANNFASNSFFFHMIGNLGFIGYNGGIPAAEQRPFFDTACHYMGSSKPEAVFLLGHWNDASSGCPAGADVPEVHQLLLTLPGCQELGVKLKFMDGHTHCNHPGGVAQMAEPVGFMVGGHGMDGCSQYGFSLVDSLDGNLSVTYFEERNANADNFEKILACVKTNGASGCKGMPYASTWLNTPLKHDDSVALSPVLEFYTSKNCSEGTLNMTIDITAHNETLCTQCWDRCAEEGTIGFPSMRLRGPGKIAIQGNCAGQYAYAGGWSDATTGGVFSEADGCHQGGASMVILCSGTIQGIQDDLDEVCGSPLPAPPMESNPAPFTLLDPTKFSGHLGEDFEWAKGAIPFIDVEADSASVADTLLATYYYRWRSYKKHIKWTSDGWILSEFLPYVPWSGRHNAIPAAAGHHVMEGRWLHDTSVTKDYIKFWFDDRQLDESFGGTTGYTSWIGWAAWQRYLVTGNKTEIAELLPQLAKAYFGNFKKQWWRDQGFGNKGCWWQSDGADAMEVSISGSGCRPTIASAMFGEAAAAAKMATLLGDAPLAANFTAEAAKTKRLILDEHWSESLQSFAVISPGGGGAPSDDPTPERMCNLSNVRPPNATVNVRELLAYMPFYYGRELIDDAALTKTGRPMWKQLFDEDGFAAEFGLRTAERRAPCYNYSFTHGDCWNGPSWPYETARVLTAAANILQEYPTQSTLTGDQYFQLLAQYILQHTATSANNDTAHPTGSGHVFENVHADLGYWNNRAIMYWGNKPGKNQGDDYNHSTLIDLILTGLFGIRPQANRTLVVNPLFTGAPARPFKSFTIEHLRYQGRNVGVQWSTVGGLQVFLDGKLAAHRATMGLLRVDV